GAVQRDGGGQFSAGLLSSVNLTIEHAEAIVAVSLERTYAEFVRQGEGFSVVGVSFFDFRGIAMGGNVAEEAQGIRLVAPFLVLMGERQRTLGEGVRLLQAAGQHLRFAQGETTERLKACHVRRSRLLQCLREQRYGVG